MDSINKKQRKYINTLALIYIEAANRVFGKTSVCIEYAVHKGIYTEIKGIDSFDSQLCQNLKATMKELIAAQLPIDKAKVSRENAIEIFRNQGMKDKVNLLSTLVIPEINLYRMDKLQFSFLGGVFRNTKDIESFDLKPAGRGLVLLMPNMRESNEVAFENQEKLFRIFNESEEWARLLEINNAGDLNRAIKQDSIGDIIRISEALHEKKIASIADMIQAKKSARLILIAGPSSSGKTTFAKRLGIQMRVNGKRFITIGLDDYFIDRDKTPLDTNGKPNFDAITALDLELFNNHLNQIIAGESVQVPSYNFITGKREYNRPPIQIDQDTYIIVEGIHGLNEDLTASIAGDYKFKIYISALTQLNVDNHNRIATTDLRLIRRMVRDYSNRGYDGEKTLDMWSNVVDGENKNIFPYQENADVMFNSSLLYELSVLRRHALPVLKKIDKNGPFGDERTRLLRLLDFFIEEADERAIPNTSLIREFIGGSCFEH